MTLTLPFDNSYARLPSQMFTELRPTPVSAPALIKVNADLAELLELDADALASEEGLQVLAGNVVAAGSQPLAQVYAGHQFGGWSPQLGDGRAILLGEVLGTDGIRRDIQLKGSGPTPYSRSGDGRAWLGPVLREYVVSEAMHALGIPTTRALAAVLTGDTVYRERARPGAVLTRVAQSHIRTGTFQYFAARGDVAALTALVDHVIARHYPEAEGALGMLQAAIARQARLIAQWMSVGFIHGVMNTDNSHVAGETIDYGPCAFMEAYFSNTVYSSIDQFGRYAYDKQPDIAVWNMAQLATSLLPIMGDREAAIEVLTQAVHAFPEIYQREWLSIFRRKIGLASAEDGDEALIARLLAVMEQGRADFTNTFRALSGPDARDQFLNREAFDLWQTEYQARLTRDGQTPEARRAMMEAANPAYIPRNHRIEQMIEAAVEGDFTPFETLNTLLARPYDDQPEFAAYRHPATETEAVRATFCGT